MRLCISIKLSVKCNRVQLSASSKSLSVAFHYIPNQTWEHLAIFRHLQSFCVSLTPPPPQNKSSEVFCSLSSMTKQSGRHSSHIQITILKNLANIFFLSRTHSLLPFHSKLHVSSQSFRVSVCLFWVEKRWLRRSAWMFQTLLSLINPWFEFQMTFGFPHPQSWSSIDRLMTHNETDSIFFLSA